MESDRVDGRFRNWFVDLERGCEFEDYRYYSGEMGRFD